MSFPNIQYTLPLPDPSSPGEAIAKSLGVIYNGPQYKGDGGLAFYTFTDPETKSTFGGTGLGSARKALADIRRGFTEATVKQPWQMDLSDFEKEHQPWEITQSQWVNMQRAERRRLGQDETSGTINAPYQDYKSYHEDQVKQAISEGKPVPAAVFADYPELKPIGVKPSPGQPYKTIIDKDGTKWEAIPTTKNGRGNFDIYMNGEKQAMGAKSPTDIEGTINQLREGELRYRESLTEKVDPNFNQFTENLKKWGETHKESTVKENLTVQPPELILWGKRGNEPYVKLTDNTSNAEMARRTKDGWTVLRYPKGESPNKIPPTVNPSISSNSSDQTRSLFLHLESMTPQQRKEWAIEHNWGSTEDSAYKALFSSTLRNPLKAGETWYSRAVTFVEKYHGGQPSLKPSLLEVINSSKPEVARAAQSVYDSWEQDKEGQDEELGGGGICDEVARAISGVFSMKGYEVVDGGQEGDDHAFPIIHDNQKAYVVDIPCQVYEIGGGYSWTKRQNVTIQPSDVIVYEVPLKDVVED